MQNELEENLNIEGIEVEITEENSIIASDPEITPEITPEILSEIPPEVLQNIPKKQIIEAALFAASEPLTLQRLQQLFAENARPDSAEIKTILQNLALDYENRGVQLKEVASGYRFQACADYAPWLQRLWEKKPPRYSRAFLETLVLIAYRQPITRGEIEEIRGVAVNSQIIKMLQDREWIKVVGSRDVPGKPALFGTTKQFLDYFNLKNLNDLPPLAEILDLEKVGETLAQQLALPIEENLSPREEVAV